MKKSNKKVVCRAIFGILFIIIGIGLIVLFLSDYTPNFPFNPILLLIFIFWIKYGWTIGTIFTLLGLFILIRIKIWEKKEIIIIFDNVISFFIDIFVYFLYTIQKYTKEV